MGEVTYIAGPMRGLPNDNWEAFFDAEESLTSLGYVCLNPARMDQEMGFVPLNETIHRDLNAVLLSDSIHLLPGWNKSVGAIAEKAVAEWAGKRICYL